MSGLHTGCETGNIGSTINCNVVDPQILLLENQTIWGNDKKGVVFADQNNLIDGNPQLKTTNPGESLRFSMQIVLERYHDSSPITEVSASNFISTGLIVDQDSLQISVNGQVLPAEQFRLEYSDGSIGIEGIGAMLSFGASLLDGDTFKYPDGAVLELTFTATVDDDAPDEVFSRGGYIFATKKGSIVMSSDDYPMSKEAQSTAILNSGLIIRRQDDNGNPISGAKYSIDGVRAVVDANQNNVYYYDENGDTEVFVTGEDGSVIIRKLPIDTYAINELSSPNGHEPQQKTMTRANYENVEEIEFGPTHYVFNLLGNADLTGYIGKTTMDDGRTIISNAEFNEALGDEPADGSRLYTYDDETQTYKNGSGSTMYIVKTQDGYRLHGEGGYRAPYNPYSINSIHDNSTDEDLVLLDYTTVLGTNVAKRDFGLEILGSQAILHDSGETRRLFYDDNEDCYKDSTGKTIVRKTDSGYRMEEGGSSLSYKYNQDAGMYTSDSIMEIYAIREVSDTQLAAYPYFPIDYSPEFDHYYTGFSIMTKQRILTETRDSLRASIVLFRDRATNDAAPEAIPNPQTSDTLTKAACIILAATTSAYIIGRTLSRR